MREKDERRKGLVEMQMEGRICHCKLESLIALINNLIRQPESSTDTSMTEMAAITTERDRQADERLKLKSELMHRRDTDVDKRMLHLMTAVQVLTCVMKTVTARTAAVPIISVPMPVAFNSAKTTFNSRVVQLPAMNKKGPEKIKFRKPFRQT